MLAEQFRSIPAHTTRMRELLADPVLLAAIVCLRDEVTEMLRGYSSDDKSLDFIKGGNNIIDLFMELAVPTPIPESQPKETWEPPEPEKDNFKAIA